MGHDAFFIKSRYDVQVAKASIMARLYNRFAPWLFHPVQSYKRHEAQKVMASNARLRRVQALEHPRGFEHFMDVNIPSTEKVCSQYELMATPPQADAYVCGSDQIWGGVNPTMYLRFAPKNSKKISYAASFGGLVPSEETQNYIREAISDFDLVTVREASGVELCKNKLGRKDAQLVPDPTLLLHAEDYRAVSREPITERHTTKPYIFLYLLGNTMSVKVSEIMNFAEKHGLDVKYVASNGRVDEYPKIYPSVEEWLYLLEHSDYVITNSFHGTVFSLIFKRKFLTIPLSKTYQRMNARIDTLFESVNLKNRLYNGCFDVLFEDVDFADFEKMQAKEIERVKTMFNSILEK